jgi:hypothetical protein
MSLMPGMGLCCCERFGSGTLPHARTKRASGGTNYVAKFREGWAGNSASCDCQPRSLDDAESVKNETRLQRKTNNAICMGMNLAGRETLVLLMDFRLKTETSWGLKPLPPKGRPSIWQNFVKDGLGILLHAIVSLGALMTPSP